ncbi:hypothetical protein ACMD2_08655, partial [Ananas comosus]
GNVYCVGFQNGGMQSKDGKDMVLLGGSSSIKVQDDKTGEVYTVNAQNISSGWRSKWGSSTALVLLTLDSVATEINKKEVYTIYFQNKESREM